MRSESRSTAAGLMLALALACNPPAPEPRPASGSPPPQGAPRGTATVVTPRATPSAAAVADTPLERAFPQLAFPRVAIGHWPTPVSEHPALAAELGLAALTVKRDDRSATPYGGSKPRKLEYLFGDAVAAGKRDIVTFGGVGSHHALATALYAPSHGLHAILLLLPQPPSDETRLVLGASQAAGAELLFFGSMAAAERHARALDDAYLIAAGGSSPIGNLGFVNAAFELKDQIDAGVVARPDDIVIALGTMGSAVGLALGLAAAELPIRVVAVRASNLPTSSRRKLEALYADTLALLRARDLGFPDVPLDRERFVVEGGYLGRGYAQPTEAGRRASALAAAHGLELDATYTAKAFAAVMGTLKDSGRRVMFWQTHSATAPPLDDAVLEKLPAALRGYARVPNCLHQLGFIHFSRLYATFPGNSFDINHSHNKHLPVISL